MFDLSKIFDLKSKKFVLPDTLLKSKNYCTGIKSFFKSDILSYEVLNKIYFNFSCISKGTLTWKRMPTAKRVRLTVPVALAIFISLAIAIAMTIRNTGVYGKLSMFAAEM